MAVKYVGGGLGKLVVAKTTNYTITMGDGGNLFTNTGAGGSVTFTLPVGAEVAGMVVDFVTTAAQAIVIASSPTDKLVVHADAAADTVTTAATIGQHFTCTSLGAAGWFVQSDPSAASAATAVTAVTIAT